MQRLRYILFGHPLSTAGVIGSLGIVANVLSGAFTFDITRTDSKSGQYLDWGASYQSRYFWILVALAVLLALYGWGMAKAGQQARRAFTDAEIRDRAYEELMPLMLESFKQDAAQGKLTPMPEVLKMLGIDKDVRP